ncbi:helix-turn-helix domain-containing protein [Bacillus aerolatus]|nr:helix-turn-helix transcriptional regulator [Bacillus aerolatus]
MMLDSSNIVGQNQKELNSKNSFSKQLSGKIENFLILCIEEQDHKSAAESKLEAGQAKSSMSALPIFTEISGTNSFIIWERVYQQSAQVFNSLRVASRNRLIRQIADNIVTYLLMKYKKLSPALSTILNDERKRMLAVQTIEAMLKKDTFLVNADVWENFCNWFRAHLTEWVLEEMTQSVGSEQLESLNKKELNELFYQYISKNLSGDIDFLTRFAAIVNSYTVDWVKRISQSLNLENCALHEIETILNLNKGASFQEFTPLSPTNDFTLTVQDYVFVMNSAPYQSVRESLYKKNFAAAHSFWPAASISKGSIEGMLQIKPLQKGSYPLAKENASVQEAWEQAEALSDLDADIFDILCTNFLTKAKHFEDVVDIQLDDLLAIRGLKSKLGGEGRRGGYELKQRRQVLKSLSLIQNLWIDLDKAVVYEKGKPVETKLQGRTFLFVDQQRKDCRITEEMNEKKISYTVDGVFAKYLFGSGRQVALLPVKTLHYDPYRKAWEKRLARYLSWRWRIQARKSDFLQPNKVSTLLEAIGIKLNDRIPSRTRDRFEKALDILQKDGLIKTWHYEKWDESIADQKGWGRIWIHSTIIIDPPEYVKEQYRPIKRNRPIQTLPKVQLDNRLSEESNKMIGSQIREIRERLSLSLQYAAEELEMSSSYLSSIERGIKTPSKKIQARLIKWLERFH